MNNMQKTPEQQIDEAVEISKTLFLPNARNPHEAESIKRNIESAGDHLKSLALWLMMQIYSRLCSMR